MKRKLSEEDLQAFIDDQLAPERRDEVINHLGADPDARRMADVYMAQKRILRERLREAGGAGRRSALTQHLAAELAERLAHKPRFVWWRHQVATAAAVFAVGWGGHVLYQEFDPWRLPAMVSGAAKAHQIFAEDSARPVELPASASAELADWFSDHLGESVQIPDLRDVGLRFVGGRLLGTERGPLAQMLYEDNRGRRLTLYLASEDTDAGPEVQVVHVDGFTAGYWMEETIAYTIVADTPEEQLLAVAMEIAHK